MKLASPPRVSPTLSPDYSLLSTLDSPPHYSLSTRLDYAAHSLKVTETISYTNRSGEPLQDLVFVVDANQREDIFFLDGIQKADGSAWPDTQLEGARLTLPLANPLLSGGSIGLTISYHLALPDIPGPLSATSRQINLGDWYPFLPPYQPGQGWVIHDPGAVGELLAYEASDYSVDIRIENAPPGFKVAASAEGKPGSQGIHYELSSARSFAWSVSNRYIVYEERSGPVAVTTYTFSEHTPAGRAAALASARAAALYHELFDPPAGGPYPHPHLSVVEADFFDGMEYEGLYFLGKEYYDEYEDSPAGYLTTLAVHETAHQWWYGMVGNDQALQPWLDEALCAYSERLYYEQAYPNLVNWWWEFRVNRFMPSGYVDGSIYEFDSFRPYVNAVYLRGALFLEHLRTLIGDKAFFAFLKDYAQSHAGQIATQKDFFALLKNHSQVDISALLKEYFE